MIWAMTDVHTDLPFDDTQDLEDAQRGFIAALEPGVVTATSRAG